MQTFFQNVSLSVSASMLGSCTQQVWLESILIWVFNSREMVILRVTLCNIRMLQSVNHIFASGALNICQICMVVVLLDPAHQITSFDASFVEFLRKSDAWWSF